MASRERRPPVFALPQTKICLELWDSVAHATGDQQEVSISLRLALCYTFEKAESNKLRDKLGPESCGLPSANSASLRFNLFVLGSWGLVFVCGPFGREETN